MDSTLSNLKPGQTGQVKKLIGSRNFIARLAALGFTIGSPITVIRNSGHGPLLVNVRGTQVALGYGEASKITVSPTEIETKINLPETAAYTIALAGQPNVGKSTIFNQLTGLNQHVGNWTGKTVEQKTGTFTYNQIQYNLVDLPGTYSLSANSEEELITREYIIREHPDLVVAVVDAATLERNLYLVAELVLLPAPILLVLNMIDVAEKEGIRIEPKVLESALGMPVVAMSASHGQGLDALESTIEAVLQHKVDFKPNRPSILPKHQSVLDELMTTIKPYMPQEYPNDWVALKLLEGDDEIARVMESRMPEEQWKKVGVLLYQHEDAILDIAGARYQWIGRMVRAAVIEPPTSRMGLTSRLDHYLTHPIMGTIFMFVILAAIFWVTYSIGGPIQSYLSNALSQLSAWLRNAMTGSPDWIIALLTNGILGGLGMVLTFLPILAIFYLALGLLEDTGYMSRAAYLTDRWMHMMGLHGKSFLPILLGFGCNVPAVMGTRIVESKNARTLTTLLVPFVPCTARMAVIAILAPLFFGKAAFLVTLGLIAGNLLLLVILGLILHRFVFEDEHVAFIMELPLYHLPNAKTIGIYIWENLIGFLKKAGTTILVASLIVWALSYFPYGEITTSYLGTFGRWLQPVGNLLGFPWQVLIALLTSFAAKENTIATLTVLYGNLSTTLSALITPASALSILVFQMLFIPCVGTIAAIRAETNSIKWTAVSIGIMLVLSFGISLLVYQVGRLF